MVLHPVSLCSKSVDLTGMFSTCGASCAIIHAAVRRTVEEHVERLQAKRLHREEVAGQQLMFVVAHERAPTDGAKSHRRRQDVMCFEHIAHGAFGNIVAQFQQFAGDLAVSPAGVFFGQTHNQVTQFLTDRRSAAGID